MSTKKLFLSVLTLAFLTGCGPTTSEPVGPTSAPTDPTVSEPTTSEPTTNTTSDPSSVTTAPVEWVDLATAIKNTSPLYELHTIGIGSCEVIEGYSGDMYFHRDTSPFGKCLHQRLRWHSLSLQYRTDYIWAACA